MIIVDGNIPERKDPFLSKLWKDRLFKIFNNGVRPVLDPENKTSIECLNVEVREVKRKKQKRVNSKINLIKYKYKTKKGEETLSILQKSTDKEKIDYERRTYEFLNAIYPLPQLVRLYGQVRGNLNALFLEYFGNEDFSDFGLRSLEGKLINFEKLMNKNPESEHELGERRHSLLATVAEAIANFHYDATASLLFKGEQNKNNDVYEFSNGYGKPWTIPKQTIISTEKRFNEHVENILKYMWDQDPSLFENKSQFNRYLKKLKDIFGKTTEVKRRSIFEWVEFGPVGLVHGDLHGGNVLCYDNDVKIIDFKKAQVSSFVNDFGFLQSPFHTLPHEERSYVFNTYIEKLRERQDGPARLNINLDGVRDYHLNLYDHLRQIYNLVKIIDNMCRFDMQGEFRGGHFDDILARRLTQLGGILNYIADNHYNIFENYQSVGDFRDCLSEKLEDKLWSSKESD